MDHVHAALLACTVAKDLPGLRRAYLADVEHRVRTRPRRMLRRVICPPAAFALDLPGALLVKPAKMEAELRVLYGRRQATACRGARGPS